MTPPSSAPIIPRPRERRQRVQAAETSIAVLKALGSLGGRASLTLIATHIDESPAKVHRYLVSLIEGGLVDQDSATQQYFLGWETLQLGVSAMRQADPIRVAEASLIRLREQLEITCFVAVMGNKGPTIIRFEEPGLPVTLNVRVGSVLPMLWSATGRALLATLDDSNVLALARAELQAASPQQRAQLDAQDPIGTLQQSVLAAGCAVVRDTNLPGISAIAAPLYNYTGRPCAVLTALGATGGFNPSPEGVVGQAVCREAQIISRLLGHSASTTTA
ncbi:IclR family transcriptional regulator [Bordetella tumulicola]|uniref:IclR family transcriptional regulator n=1 Tax=Bordetella tumulicola TaxID=1649133 RepID=UPI0039EFF0B9